MQQILGTMIINRTPNSGPSKRKKRPPAADARGADVAAGGRFFAVAELPNPLNTEGKDPPPTRGPPFYTFIELVTTNAGVCPNVADRVLSSA